MSDIDDKRYKLRAKGSAYRAKIRAGSDCIRQAYFATGHTSTHVELALGKWLKQINDPDAEWSEAIIRPKWAQKIADHEPLFTATGGYGPDHTQALQDVADITWGDYIPSEISMMILTISFKGAASNYAWIAYQSGNPGILDWVQVCTKTISNLRYHPQLLVGVDPFSECGP